MANTKIELCRYAVQNAPGGCLDVVLACADDGASHWEDLFRHGLPDAIASNLILERRLFRDLCNHKVKAHASAILRTYLAKLSSDHHAQFFAAAALEKKNHPANHIFCWAAFKTPDGAIALAMLETLIKEGLQGDQLQALATRRHGDVAKAVKQGNQAFLTLLFQHLKAVPVKLLVYVVTNNTHGLSLVSRLIDDRVVPLARFLEPEVQGNANAGTRQMISDLDARATRTLSRTPF